MRELVFATNNAHKLEEVTNLLQPDFKLLSLNEIGCNEEIEETASTLEGNALIKARYIHDTYKCDCFSDDTGLEVEALDGAPGVYSARYAGEEKSAEANMQKLLIELKGKTNRKAKFRTVIALILEGKEYIFEGEVAGIITHKKLGGEGFGYDPIFLPNGFQQTFAELPLSEKNKISHRARAVNQLVHFLKTKAE